MDLTTINSHLSERRIVTLADAVSKLETAISSGSVKNTLFVDAKDTINRAVDEAERAFSDRTRFYGDVLVMGAYNLPAALKEATKKNLPDRAAFISSMIPLNNLLNLGRLDLWTDELDKEITEKIAATKAKNRWNALRRKVDLVKSPNDAFCDAIEAALSLIKE